MKKYYNVMVALMLPVSAMAQPVITSAENNTIGTVVRRLVCDPVSAGPGGAAQSWNFSNLTPTGDTIVAYNIAPIPGHPFTGANLAQSNVSDSTYSHFEQTSNETILLGMLDSSGNNASITYDDGMLLMRRPFTYADTATDSFSFTTNFSGFPVYAAGGLAINADGYGTLYLPNDTFTNVLRVRIETHEQDSIDGIGNVFIDNVYYVWYSNLHSSPLLRVDSINISGMASLNVVDVQYFLMETPTTGINTLPAQRQSFSANLQGNSLLLAGELHRGRNYEVGLFSVDGRKLFGTNFAADESNPRFNIAAEMPGGTYIVTLRKMGDSGSFKAIKIVKQ